MMIIIIVIVVIIKWCWESKMLQNLSEIIKNSKGNYLHFSNFNLTIQYILLVGLLKDFNAKQILFIVINIIFPLLLICPQNIKKDFFALM